MSPFPSSADSEGRAYRNASPGLRFFLTAALSLALMYLDHRGTYLEQVRGLVAGGAASVPKWRELHLNYLGTELSHDPCAGGAGDGGAALRSG